MNDHENYKPPKSSPKTVTLSIFSESVSILSLTASQTRLAFSFSPSRNSLCFSTPKKISPSLKYPPLLATITVGATVCLFPATDSVDSRPLQGTVKEKLAPCIFSIATHFLMLSSFLESHLLVYRPIFSYATKFCSTEQDAAMV